MAYNAKRRFRFKKGVNIGRVVSKLAVTVIGLWIGGTVISQIGNVLNQTESPFYQSVSLIGWTVGTYPACAGANYSTTCAVPAGCAALGQATAVGQNCITDVSDAGVLAVIGVIGIASIALEFVEFKL